MKNDHQAQWSKLAEHYNQLSQVEEIVHGLLWLIPIVLILAAIYILS